MNLRVKICTVSSASSLYLYTRFRRFESMERALSLSVSFLRGVTYMCMCMCGSVYVRRTHALRVLSNAATGSNFLATVLLVTPTTLMTTLGFLCLLRSSDTTRRS